MSPLLDAGFVACYRLEHSLVFTIIKFSALGLKLLNFILDLPDSQQFPASAALQVLVIVGHRGPGDAEMVPACRF